MLGVLCKNVIFLINDPLGSQYLFEILHTSFIIKIRDVVKMDVSKNPSNGGHQFIFEMSEGNKASCAKIISQLIRR